MSDPLSQMKREYHSILDDADSANRVNFVPSQSFTWGAYHLTENVGNSGWKVNGKVTFRKFQPKIEEYVLR